MSVDVRFRGRLGNNMFQYAIGRILAEHHGFELNCQLPALSRSVNPAVRATSLATLPDLSNYFPNAPLHIAGANYTRPEESFIVNEDGKWNGNTIDLVSLLSNSSPRQIHLSGYFQRYEYYAPYRDQIRTWFFFNTVPTPFRVLENDVLLSIRRGYDFGFLDWLLPLTYYENTLEKLRDVGRVYVCGTSIDDQVRQRLDKYAPTYLYGSPVEHFAFIKRFNRIILSNSTFVWWAAFLSDASELYAPIYTNGSAYGFRGPNDVDLNIREKRYVEVEVTSTDKLTFSIRRRVLQTILQKCVNKTTLSSSTEVVLANMLAENPEFIEWIIQQHGRLIIRDMVSHYRGANLEKIVRILVSLGALESEVVTSEIV